MQESASKKKKEENDRKSAEEMSKAALEGISSMLKRNGFFNPFVLFSYIFSLFKLSESVVL